MVIWLYGSQLNGVKVVHWLLKRLSPPLVAMSSSLAAVKVECLAAQTIDWFFELIVSLNCLCCWTASCQQREQLFMIRLFEENQAVCSVFYRQVIPPNNSKSYKRKSSPLPDGSVEDSSVKFSRLSVKFSRVVKSVKALKLPVAGSYRGFQPYFFKKSTFLLQQPSIKPKIQGFALPNSTQLLYRAIGKMELFGKRNPVWQGLTENRYALFLPFSS